MFKQVLFNLIRKFRKMLQVDLYFQVFNLETIPTNCYQNELVKVCHKHVVEGGLGIVDIPRILSVSCSNCQIFEEREYSRLKKMLNAKLNG